MIDPRLPDYANTPGSASRPRFSYAPADTAAPAVVTIVTPYFNAGSHFAETADTVLNQSLQQFEWLIVNDGSTETAARAQLAEYRQRDPRIRVIDHAKNEGLPAARNTGMAAARAKYVFLLDDDDLLEPTALEKAFWFLETYPQYAAASAWSVGFGAQEYLWARGFERGDAFLTENQIPAQVLLRMSAVQAAGGFDPTLRDGFEDWDFWLRLANAGLWGATIPEYLTWYRRRADHGERWQNLAGPEPREKFAAALRARYPRLFAGGFPPLAERADAELALPRKSLPCANLLRKEAQRLLLIVPWLELGGADKFNLDLVSRLRAAGWEVTIAATAEAAQVWLPEFAAHTPDVFALRRFLPVAEHASFLRYLIESRRPDIVLTTQSEAGYLLLPYLRSCCPAPAYLDYNHIEDEPWRGGGYPRYAALFDQSLDLHAVSSEHLKRWITKAGAPADRVQVVYTGVDTERFQPNRALRAQTRAAHNIPDNLAALLYAGRLCAQKQPRVFAGTMRALAERNARFVALVAGDGPDRPWLEEFIEQHKLSDRVRLLGDQTLEQMRALYVAADVFFLPSEWEGIALSVYEALASGLAVVGADVGGQRELVDAQSGVLLPRGTPEEEIAAYADVLERLIKNAAERIAFGRRARQGVLDGFGLDRMVAGMLSAFERAKSLHAAQPRPALPADAGYLASVFATEYLRVSGSANELWKVRAANRRELAALEAARAWLEQHARNWEQAAESHLEQARTAEDAVKKLEEAKTWLQAQVEERERTIGELRAWAERLEADNQRLAERIKTLYSKADEWRGQLSYRALRKLGIQRELDLE